MVKQCRWTPSCHNEPTVRVEWPDGEAHIYCPLCLKKLSAMRMVEPVVTVTSLMLDEPDTESVDWV